MKRAILALAILGAAEPAAALEVRFFPASAVYSYDLAGDRDAHAVIVQNVAVLNDGDAPVALTDIQVDLLQGQRVLDERRMGAPELAKAAKTGQSLAGDLWRLLSFQFGGDTLVPSAMQLASSPTLKPGEALIFTSQIFAYRGARDSVRVTVNGGAAQASLPIRNEASKTEFHLPLEGVWYVGSGPSFNTPHRWSPMEEFAFDLVQVEQGSTHRGDGARFTDYYAYGKPVLAAAEGIVVSVVADQAEDPKTLQQPNESIQAFYGRLQGEQMGRIAQGAAAVTGNSVVIDHGKGEFSIYAHLKPGSLRVRVGDRVVQGQPIGEVGSTGNSTEPHLHFQVCDGPDPLYCAGIPVRFAPSPDPLRNPPHAPQAGDFLVGSRDGGVE